MKELVFIVEQESDGGFVAHAVGPSIITQADTRAQLDDMIRNAIRCHFDSEEDMPQLVRLQFVREEVIAV